MADNEAEAPRNLIDELHPELRLLHEAVWALASEESDDLAFGAVLHALARSFAATDGALTFRDGRGELCRVETGKPFMEELGAEAGPELVSLMREAASPAAVSRAPRAMVVGVESMGEALVALSLERSTRDFGAEERESAARLLRDLEPTIGQRMARSRHELTRRRAEQELRRSEERLRAFFEESPDMIYTANAEDRIASINSAGLRLLGLADRFDCVGAFFSDFALSPGDRRIFLERMRADGVVANYEILLKRADGGPVFCLETAQAVKDREGRIVEIQGIVRDITQRVEAERELWKANLELAEANVKLRDTQVMMIQNEKLASIGQLAAGIAHEINNPLGFLKSNHAVLRRYLDVLGKAWAEALAARPELEELAARHDLGYILEQAAALGTESDEGFRRIMEIIQGLRSFARIEVDAGFAPYDLDKGVRSTLVVARNEIKYVAEVELELGSPPAVPAMGNQVNQVLLNILVNSAQAIASRGKGALGHIRVRTGAERGFVFCRISDDGPGIPADILSKIFDPFFTTKEPGKGTGLGLSISYDIIVSKHKGRLAARGSELGGAEFLVELPMERKGSGADE